MNRVAIVGMGMADSLGFTPDECWAKMLDPHDYSADVPELLDDEYCKVKRGAVIDWDRFSQLFDDTYNRKEMRAMTNAQKLMLYTTEQALKSSGLPIEKEVAVIQSTVSNDTEMLEQYYDSIYKQRPVNIRKAVNRIPDIGNHHICQRYGFEGMSTSTFSSCASGLNAIDYGMRIAEDYEYVVVGGSDAGCFGMGVKYFTLLQATGSKSMPFDDDREGFLMGDGGATLILMDESKLWKYGVKPIAWLYKAGGSSDGADLTAPDGAGSIRAMKKALKNADIQKVDAVCGHATSTPIGDPVEYTAVWETLGEVPLWAPKGKIGHTLAGAGVIETIYCILAMQNRKIPHIQNLNKSTLDFYKMLVTKNTGFVSHTPRMLNNSFGFGGKCMSQVVELNV